jgi:hypothetical protein
LDKLVQKGHIEVISSVCNKSLELDRLAGKKETRKEFWERPMIEVRTYITFTDPTNWIEVFSTVSFILIHPGA